MNTRENLVFVPGFPTNSIILTGLSEFLSQFFNVYFIDLPGFRSNLKPLPEVSFEAYGGYVLEQIHKLNLKNYLVAGASFGFPVVCAMTTLPNHCKAILALEPYINTHYLRFRPERIKLISSLSGKLAHMRIGENFFDLPLVSKILSMATSITPQAAQTIRDEFDSRTFLTITQLLLSYEKLPHFHSHIPHILSVNEQDATLAVPKVVALFQKHIQQLMIIPNSIDHWPKQNSAHYFAEGMDSNDINKALQWLSTTKGTSKVTSETAYQSNGV